MIRKITTTVFMLPLLMSLGMIAPAAAMQSGGVSPMHVTASFQGDACNGIGQLGGTGCGGNPGSSLTNLMTTVINLLSLIAGFIAVIMVIVSAIRFMTANGEASGIASARSALIYALIGVVVAAIAQILVHFVIGKVVLKK
jgi:hypothetical protein